MTAEIVNLRRVRKQRQRAERAAEAAANRALTGPTKAERSATQAERAAQDRTLDGARRQWPQRPVAANEGSFPATAAHADEDLDPGTVS